MIHFLCVIGLKCTGFLKKNEYFCIFLSLRKTLFSGPRRFFPRNDFYNIGLKCNGF
jgi:hypothetical protein